MSVRVRFAPSPTGFLHIGGARTALFNWLYARHCGGSFILRIEDTDVARNTQEAVDVIIQGLRWLGLDWDEGPGSGDVNGPLKGDFGPYFQSQRAAIYRSRVEELMRRGAAYAQEGTIKFRMERNPIVIPDLVVGNVTRELTDRERLEPDFVIVRSDGQPVFHLVNVVDDLEMKITHVIRGEDHLSNTAKHIALLRAFGVEPPQYAHIPLILNIDGTKMSKRDRGASLSTYIEEGYAPEAVVNYLCLLGWSPKANREVVPIKEVIELFDLPQILRHNARFDMNKLHWMNGQYIRSMSLERFHQLAVPALQRAGLDVLRFPSDYVRAALATCKEKIKLLSELPGFGGFYFTDEISYESEAAEKDFTAEHKIHLTRLRQAFATQQGSDAAGWQKTLSGVAAEFHVKPGALVHPTRLACTGRTVGPSLYHLLEVLGPDKVLQRLDRAIARMPEEDSIRK